MACCLRSSKAIWIDTQWRFSELQSSPWIMDDAIIWATQDLPVPTPARKLFLLGSRSQVGQWGFVKREILVDDSYETLLIDNKVIVKVFVSEHDLKLEWADEWARWQNSRKAVNSRNCA